VPPAQRRFPAVHGNAVAGIGRSPRDMTEGDRVFSGGRRHGPAAAV